MKVNLTNDYFNNLATSINDATKSINTIINDIQSLLKVSSECCRYTRKIHEQSQPFWFDNECKKLKKFKYKSLRQYRQSRSIHHLDNYKTAKIDFRNTCDAKKLQYNTRQLEELYNE